MQRKPAKRSSLFLLELIIAILFFCLASAVCVRFFVKSHLIERDTTALNHAANYASSVAEMVRSSEDLPACLKEQFPEGASRQEGDYMIYFNHDWNTCSEDDAAYSLNLSYKQADNFLLGRIVVSDSQESEEIYSLEVKKYLQKMIQKEAVQE